MTQVKLERLKKTFEKTVAVDDISVQVESGEFFTFLGPSGCGKSTTLRIIGGFEEPDEGDVHIGGKSMLGLAPNERPTAMVFQTYALWPHMTVYDNISYGLKLKRLKRDLIDQRVQSTMKLLGLSGLEKRYPTKLSGGQQQRVALARALIVEPQVLLLDEPLSNLDAKLRVRTRQQITNLQQSLEITMIYVTHDQEEALSMSDRIAVMHNGKILQIGSPTQIYQEPTNSFVADFIGTSNFIFGTVQDMDSKTGKATVNIGDRQLLQVSLADDLASIGDKVQLVVRPESLEMVDSCAEKNTFEGVVEAVTFMGSIVRYEVRISEQTVVQADVIDPAGKRMKHKGDKVIIFLDEERVIPIAQ